jgi:hypothetical protein
MPLQIDVGASLQASHTPASQHIKAHIRWRREVHPSHFQNLKFEIVLNDCKAGIPKKPCICAGFSKVFLK